MIQCKVCDSGAMQHQKVNRLSGPAVAIGYLLLIPSICGIILAASMFLMVIFGAAATASGETAREVHMEALEDLDIPTELVGKIQRDEDLSAAERESLTNEQRSAIDAIELSMAGSAAAGGCFAFLGTTFAAFIAVTSFVGGLIGWLLVMRKKVLRCDHCGAIVEAA